jgi:transcriptional regulator with XRE-family HTH domain
MATATATTTTTTGERVRLARLARGLSIRALQRRAGVCDVGHLERGHNRGISTIARVARGLEVPLAWLVDDGRSATCRR